MWKYLKRKCSRLSGRVAAHPAIVRHGLAFSDWLSGKPWGMRMLHRLFRRKTWYYLMRARIFRKSGRDHDAFRELMLGQRCVADDYRLHLKLSELYRDNGDVSAAHAHLKIAETLKPGYSTIRLLTFETDHGMTGRGSATMERVLEMPLPAFRRHIPMLNRVSIHYPEHREKLRLVRAEHEKLLDEEISTSGRDLTKPVESAIANRWLSKAISCAARPGVTLQPATRGLLDRLAADLGAHTFLLETAWHNENHGETLAIVDGKAVSLAQPGLSGRRPLELFIPTPFFADPESEKPTYGTVRAMFRNILAALLDRDDILLVPRHQLYWRQCVPKIPGSLVISYHTNSPPDPARLHIQEAPLAGRCSMDSAGFAGFSTIATDHEPVREFVRGVDPALLARNRGELYETYVTRNVSKYNQPEDEGDIEGEYVFVALQIPTDVVSRLARMTGMELLDGVVEHFRGTGVKVLVKRHPFCGSMGVCKHLDELEAAGDIQLTNRSIHGLIRSARAVITVNSGVGLEALLHGKTVIVSGACDYSYAARQVGTCEELQAALAADPAPDLRRIDELLYYYVHRFTLDATDAPAIRARLGEWLGNLMQDL